MCREPNICIFSTDKTLTIPDENFEFIRYTNILLFIKAKIVLGLNG